MNGCEANAAVVVLRCRDGCGSRARIYTTAQLAAGWADRAFDCGCGGRGTVSGAPSRPLDPVCVELQPVAARDELAAAFA